MLSFLLLCAFGASASATENQTDSATVFVTLSDDKGYLALSQEAITVTDSDQDGALTLNDALYAAHEAKYEGGAATGYASSMGPHGLAIDKLWGVANGGSYGYYINNDLVMGLADPIKNGDYINAYVYTDLSAWSDTFCYFNSYTLTAEEDKSFTLTLSASGYDAAWNSVTLPVEGAEITVNGQKTGIKTDKNGKATVVLSEAGNYVISALSDSQTLVPPVCKVAVSATASVVPSTGDDIYMLVSASMLALAVISIKIKRRVYEK